MLTKSKRLLELDISLPVFLSGVAQVDSHPTYYLIYNLFVIECNFMICDSSGCVCVCFCVSVCGAVFRAFISICLSFDVR